MTYVLVDNTREIFGDRTSIADLAQFTPFIKEFSEKQLSIYQVELLMGLEWSNEIERFEYTFAEGYTAFFKDGSKLWISAENTTSDTFWYSDRGIELAKRIHQQIQ